MNRFNNLAEEAYRLGLFEMADIRAHGDHGLEDAIYRAFLSNVEDKHEILAEMPQGSLWKLLVDGSEDAQVGAALRKLVYRYLDDVVDERLRETIEEIEALENPNREMEDADYRARLRDVA